MKEMFGPVRDIQEISAMPKCFEKLSHFTVIVQWLNERNLKQLIRLS